MLCRLNALSSLGEEFDATSTNQKMSMYSADVYQAWAGVVCPYGGMGGRGGGGGVLFPHPIQKSVNISAIFMSAGKKKQKKKKLAF